MGREKATTSCPAHAYYFLQEEIILSRGIHKLKDRICILFFCHSHSHSHSHSALCNVYPVALDRNRRLNQVFKVCIYCYQAIPNFTCILSSLPIFIQADILPWLWTSAIVLWAGCLINFLSLSICDLNESYRTCKKFRVLTGRSGFSSRLAYKRS